MALPPFTSSMLLTIQFLYSPCEVIILVICDSYTEVTMVCWKKISFNGERFVSHTWGTLSVRL